MKLYSAESLVTMGFSCAILRIMIGLYQKIVGLFLYTRVTTCHMALLFLTQNIS